MFEPFRKRLSTPLDAPLKHSRGRGHESTTDTLTRSTDRVPPGGSEALAGGCIKYPHSSVPPPRVVLADNGRQGSRNQGSPPVAFLNKAWMPMPMIGLPALLAVGLSQV